MSERARIVAVYSAGGGTGKTLVASNLALSLHQQQSGRVLLVDGGHPMPGDLPIVLGVDRVKALADMVPIIGRLTPEVFASYLVTTREGLPLMSLVTDVIQSRLDHAGALQQDARPGVRSVRRRRARSRLWRRTAHAGHARPLRQRGRGRGCDTERLAAYAVLPRLPALGPGA